MILLIIGFIFLVCSLILFYKSNQIKIVKNQQQEKYENNLKNEISNLEKEKIILINDQAIKQEQINENLLKWQKSREEEIKQYIENRKKLADKSVQERKYLAQKAITEINQNLENFKIIAQQDQKKIQNELDKLKTSLSAGVEARLREQEKKEKLDFYKLSISDADLADVKMLENLKASFHKPVVLSKLIWTQYFQKQMTELCDRVLGKKTICGIYKITNLVTQQCYIGQSVNVSQRWKQHCKCGLGIQASVSNKLYNSMQKDKIWNFTFELLEECPRQLLNEKEAFWIDMYQSNKFGLNTMKGRI